MVDLYKKILADQMDALEEELAEMNDFSGGMDERGKRRLPERTDESEGRRRKVKGRRTAAQNACLDRKSFQKTKIRD